MLTNITWEQIPGKKDAYKARLTPGIQADAYRAENGDWVVRVEGGGLLFMQPDRVWNLLLECPGRQSRRIKLHKDLPQAQAEQAAGMALAAYAAENAIARETRGPIPKRQAPICVDVNFPGHPDEYIVIRPRESLSPDEIRTAIAETAGMMANIDCAGALAAALRAYLKWDVEPATYVTAELPAIPSQDGNGATTQVCFAVQDMDGQTAVILTAKPYWEEEHFVDDGSSAYYDDITKAMAEANAPAIATSVYAMPMNGIAELKTAMLRHGFELVDDPAFTAFVRGKN